MFGGYMAEKDGVHAKTQEPDQKHSNSCKQKLGCSSESLPDRILQLQRTAGNHAVQRLINSKVLQAKLKIGQPGDIYEQEADRVAKQVMSIPKPSLQRKCAECDEDEKKVLQSKKFPGQTLLTQGQDVPPIVQDELHCPGQPIDRE
jgi:hypothetical protein